ncbi:hypothetical protein M0R45_001694 [Rubus argutus]|uniref:Uncharacterized protein n=1 Tax=Rubus argutus TaxID=59490 RepID=A0AAW1VHY2_RUBAR
MLISPETLCLIHRIAALSSTVSLLILDSPFQTTTVLFPRRHCRPCLHSLRREAQTTLLPSPCTKPTTPPFSASSRVPSQIPNSQQNHQATGDPSSPSAVLLAAAPKTSSLPLAL